MLEARRWLQVLLARPGVVWIFLVILLATTVIAPIVGVWSWSWSTTFSDQLTAVGVTFAVATFLLAAEAGLIVLAAYLVATQAPDLAAEFQFPFMDAGAIVLMIDPTDMRDDGRSFLANFRQLEGTVLIRNRSPFSAHNPACRIELRGLAGLRHPGSGWVPIQGHGAAQDDVTIVQWDGGVDYLIHGNWPRPLPLDLRSTVDLGTPQHSVLITVVADGIPPREREIEVRLLHAAEWLQHFPEAENQVPVRILDHAYGGPVPG